MMRLLVLTLAVGLATAATVSANGAPVRPNLEDQHGSNIVQVAGGCGPGEVPLGDTSKDLEEGADTVGIRAGPGSLYTAAVVWPMLGLGRGHQAGRCRMAGEELGLAEAIDAVRSELRRAQNRGRRAVATFERLVVDSAGLSAPHPPR